MIEPPLWLLWFACLWAALTFVVALLLLVAVAWVSARNADKRDALMQRLEDTARASRGATDDGNRLLAGLDPEEHDRLNNGHG